MTPCLTRGQRIGMLAGLALLVLIPACIGNPLLIGLGLALGVCAIGGIGLEALIGPAAQTPLAQHEGGRLLSSQPEPEWDEREQDWMLALSEYEAGLCPNCGRPMSVCTDPKNEFRFKTGLPTRCHAATSKLIAQEAAKEAPHGNALMFHTVLNEG